MILRKGCRMYTDYGQMENIDQAERLTLMPDENRIRATVQKSVEAFYREEEKRRLSYSEFLRIQLGTMKKRWWIMQMALLMLLYSVLQDMQTVWAVKRSMGAAAVLFVVLIIPDLWKSRTYGLAEVESASYFSLRGIYAARLVLFGIADTLMLTLFCGTAYAALGIAVVQLTVQFLLPMTVTAAVCFGVLCSRYPFGEAMAVFICLTWGTAWILAISNDTLYEAVIMPVWFLLLAAAVVFAVTSVCRLLQADHYREVFRDGIKTD